MALIEGRTDDARALVIGELVAGVPVSLFARVEDEEAIQVVRSGLVGMCIQLRNGAFLRESNTLGIEGRIAQLHVPRPLGDGRE